MKYLNQTAQILCHILYHVSDSQDVINKSTHSWVALSIQVSTCFASKMPGCPFAGEPLT